MKKLTVLVLTLVCVLGLVGCNVQSEYAVSITVPAGNRAEFVCSDEEISPRKSRVEIKSADMPKDAKFVLKPVDATQGDAFECTDFPKGEPMLIEAEKGVWYKIGIAVENPADEDIVVVFHIKNVKVRIE